MGIFSFVKAGGKRFATIKSVKPNVGKSKLQKALGDVKITALKTKGQMKKGSQDFDAEIDKAKAKLGQTTQKIVGEPVTKSGISKGKDMKKFKTPSLNPKPINKAKGGRVGLKLGTKRKTNVEKIKKTFGTKKGLGMQSVIYGLDKNPNITKADPKAKFIAAAKKKKNKKVIG